MKTIKLTLAAVGLVASAQASAQVYDEASLRSAIEAANLNANISKIVFAKHAEISLNAPVIYTGSQSLQLIGKGAIIDGSNAGSFVLDDDLTAVTEDGTLVFNTAGDISIHNLTIKNSATRGVVVNIPEQAEGSDIHVDLNGVTILDSALYGLHIDDNADEFDDGTQGSAIGVDLKINHSRFVGNGTGAIDFDGVRVDERQEGDITALIMNTQIDANGGDGMELDEAGAGNVDATFINVTLNDNGFYNEADLDDGLDIDEADEGSIDSQFIQVTVNNNLDEGLDLDEAGEGSLTVKARQLTARNNNDEGLKADEEDAGDIIIKLRKAEISNNGDDGMQLTELGEGRIQGSLRNIKAKNNAKYGVKAEQWVEEDEAVSIEPAGVISTRKVKLSGNGDGDTIKTNNIILN
ncbi:MAG: hypothetical protein R3E62_09960 [Pseudomonadales bacterium]